MERLFAVRAQPPRRLADLGSAWELPPWACAEGPVPPHALLELVEPPALGTGLTVLAGEGRHAWASPPEVWDVISPRVGGPNEMCIFEFPLPAWPMGWGRSSLHAVAAGGDKERAGLVAWGGSGWRGHGGELRFLPLVPCRSL